MVRNLKEVKEKYSINSRKDLFLKGFDKQLIGVKKNEDRIVEATLPENFTRKRASE